AREGKHDVGEALQDGAQPATIPAGQRSQQEAEADVHELDKDCQLDGDVHAKHQACQDVAAERIGAERMHQRMRTQWEEGARLIRGVEILREGSVVEIWSDRLGTRGAAEDGGPQMAVDQGKDKAADDDNENDAEAYDRSFVAQEPSDRRTQGRNRDLLGN